MRKLRVKHSPLVLIVSINLILLSCNKSPNTIPFPQHESEFSAPVTKPLTFGKPRKIEWTFLSNDSIKPPDEKPFSLATLPSKPFPGLLPSPLLRPMQVHHLHWEKLPRSALAVNDIVARPLKFKTSILGEPQKTKAGLPRLKDGARESIFLLGQDQGLSGTVISSFTQDKNGTLWIATDNGVDRFDGEFFEIYTREQGLTSNYRTGVFADSKERVWTFYIQPYGLELIDKKTRTLKRPELIEGSIGKFVTGVIEDKKGRIWVSTWNGGLSIIDDTAGTIRHIDKKDGLSSNKINCIMEDSKGRIWIGLYESGIDVLDVEQLSLFHLDKRSGLFDDKVQTINESPSGAIFVGTNEDVQIIDQGTGIISQLDAQNGLNVGRHVSSITFQDDVAWIGTAGEGVQLFDLASQTISHLNTKKGLSNDDISNVFTDIHGQIWIGTFAGEINIYDTRGGSFQHLTSADGLNNKSTWYYALVEDNKNRKWIGTHGEGIDVLDEQKQTIQHLGQAEGLGSNDVLDLMIDSKERIWIGCSGMNPSDVKVNQVDLHAGTIKSFGIAQGFRYNDSEVNFLEDRKGAIWISKGGLHVFDEKNHSVKLIKKDQSLISNTIWDLTEDMDGEIWIGAEDGVYVIDSAANELRLITNKEIHGMNILSCKIDSRGLIWISTYGNGVIMVNKKEGTITNFSVNEGLTDRLALSVIERNGSIYIGTGKGLSVLTPFTETDPTDSSSGMKWRVGSFAKSQGLLRVDHNPASMLSSDGRLWFGIADVLTTMKEVVDDTNVPTPLIIGIDILEKHQPFTSQKWRKEKLKETDTIWNTTLDTFYLASSIPPDTSLRSGIRWDDVNADGVPEGLELPYNKNHLTFRFSGVHLDNLDKTRYRFVLEGNDETWSKVTDRYFADYRNLAPGRYVFKVSAKGANEHWSKPATMSFTVLPPWWKSNWAYGFYSLCLGGLLFFVGQIQHARVVKRERERSREVELAQAKQIEKAYHELKTTQQQLIHAEKMASLGEVTAGIAHEIQNPLNFVNNFSELNRDLLQEMKQEIDKGSLNEIRGIVDDVISNEEKINLHGKRADSIVKGMLQHTRTGSGQKELTDLNSLIDESLRLSYNGFRARDKNFESVTDLNLDSSIGKVSIIPQDVGKVLFNLFSNAFYAVSEKKKAIPGNFTPTVSVRTARVGGNIYINIKDNGMGIPTKNKDKVFQPFFTTKPTGQGTGLGLSLSYDIVKAHGGEIKVDSEEGEGTEFVVVLLLQAL